MPARLLEVLATLGRPHITVVGDLMLDRYLWGAVDRVSPEAPIPVVHVRQRDDRPGGAGNVAQMLVRLDARVLCCGCVGSDAAGQELRGLLEEGGVDCGGVVKTGERVTTLKTRVMGSVVSAGRGLQQIVRIDEEDTREIDGRARGAILDAVRAGLGETDLVLIQDMAKGVCSPELLRGVIEDARAAGRPVVVDPAYGRPIEQYRGADGLIPNRREAAERLGRALDSPEDWEPAAREILEGAELGWVILKLDKDGLYVLERGERGRHVPTEARQVADVTGAGDMVASAAAVVLAAGGKLDSAVRIANIAAGIEVGRIGATPVSRRELREHLRSLLDPASLKIKRLEELLGVLEEVRADGGKVAFTNGCFDLLHVGHVELLKFARTQGDVLVVGLNTDRSVRELKGPDRPVNSEEVRARILAAIEDVDYVVLFDEASVEPLVRRLRPDVLVKGGQYRIEEVVGAEFVMSYGGRVARAPHVEGFSTTDIINKIGGQ
jgi:D-beta-D-heptose 7-phosphate kinase/D-beta-D-heptose 1-phosphate adenosyltransferase